MEKPQGVAVRRRADGIAEIVPARVRHRRHEPRVAGMALALVALGLYVATLVSAAVVVLLFAGCAALPRRARRDAAARARADAAVRPLPLTASQR